MLTLNSHNVNSELNVEVVLLPSLLGNRTLSDRTVVVFDVLRATTTIISGLASGVRQFRAFASLDEAKAATEAAHPRPIFSGELHALPAPGVDLGNSPRQWKPEHAGRDVYLATTNGTKAMSAARSASKMFLGALVNARAAAQAAAHTGHHVLLLCSGTLGDISMEDLLGAGAVATCLTDQGYPPATDTTRIAIKLFDACRNELVPTLYTTQGGRNTAKAGLQDDIDFAARLDVFDFAPRVDLPGLVIHRP
jgi:2-phosphosulfolactate phosphatase